MTNTISVGPGPWACWRPGSDPGSSGGELLAAADREVAISGKMNDVIGVGF